MLGCFFILTPLSPLLLNNLKEVLFLFKCTWSVAGNINEVNLIPSAKSHASQGNEEATTPAQKGKAIFTS